VEGYLEFITWKLSDLGAFLERGRALMDANTLGLQSVFFSGRLSGGFTSTTRRSGASGSNQTAAR